MAEKKIHKQEKPNKVELTPKEKKAKDLRDSGLSLREIAEKLNISRKEVEGMLSPNVVIKVINKSEEKSEKKGK